MLRALGYLITLVPRLILQYLKQLCSHRYYPPGPLPLPFIGGLWRLGLWLSQDTFTKLEKCYGEVYTLWIGHIPVVFLSGFRAVKEGLITYSEDLADRPVTPFLEAALKHRGIMFSNGHTWKQQRRFGQVSMRKIGLGKKGMEHQIEEEAHRLVETFARAKGQPFDPSPPITKAVSNVICALAFGNQFSTEDKNMQKLLETLDFGLNFGGSFFHVSKDDPHTTYNEENLAECVIEFFGAGTETTTTTLKWAFLLMATHPDIQEAVQKEIDNIFHSSYSICYQDRKKLPYTNAVIHEIQRVRYVFLLGVPRQNMKDINLLGLLIPKGSFIMPDLRSVLLDRKQWETPEEFNPHHFLDLDGNFIDRDEFLAFGAGSRVCLGEQLARIEIFIFFTNLLRFFRFQLPKGVKRIRKEPVVGLTMHPHPYKLCAVPRCGSPEK